MRTLSEASIKNGWKSFLAYREKRLHGVQTGIGALDQYLLGLGGITTVQGETSAGKSTIALQFVHHNLKLGNPAIMLDRENGENRLKMRLMCQANSISENDIKVCSLESLREYSKPVRELPLYVYTESVANPDFIKQRIGDCLQLHEDKHLLLLIDSIQAMPSLDPDRALNIEKWMGYFDQLKLDFEGKLTVLITSEINRASYGQDGGLGAGKGSNAIEFKSETLMDVRTTSDPNVIKVLVAKNRDGLRGAIFMLEKVLADANNEASFTFKFKAQNEELVDV